MIKKLFIISFTFLIITLVFGGIYYFVFKKGSTQSAPEPLLSGMSKDSPDLNSAPEASKKEGKIYAVSEDAVISPTLTGDKERIKYYNRVSGNVFEISLEGEDKRTLSSNNLFDLENILWSPDKDKVISIFKKEGKKTFFTYDYNNRSGKKLADGITNAAWSALGDKIIYHYFDAAKNKGNVAVAEPDGGNWQNLASASARSVNLAPVPQTSMVSFWNAPSAYDETSLEAVNMLGGEAKKIFSGKYGADYLWSPDGSKILISSSDSKGSSKMSLGTANSNGGEYRNLNIPTLTSKCAWSRDGKFVYYALPGSIPDGAFMPNDYLAKKITTQDTFWKMDTSTGKTGRIVELSDLSGAKQTFDAENLFFSSSGDALFFTNRVDGKLYRIDL